MPCLRGRALRKFDARKDCYRMQKPDDSEELCDGEVLFSGKRIFAKCSECGKSWSFNTYARCQDFLRAVSAAQCYVRWVLQFV